MRMFEAKTDPACRSVEMEPDQATNWIEQGNLYFAKGDLESAGAAYRAAHQTRSDQLSNYSLGLIEETRGIRDKAATFYGAAIAADPEFVPARVNLAHLLRREGMLVRALHNMLFAYALEPGHPLTAFGVAEVAVDMGRADLARRYVPVVAGRDETLARTLEIRLASAPDPIVVPLDAIVASISDSALDQISALDPADPGTWTDLGNAFLAEGRFDDAIALQHHALSIDPLSVVALNNYGVAFRLSGRPHEAVRPLLLALALKPDWALAWTNLGRAYLDDGALELAFDAYTIAARDPEASDETLALLAEIARRTGRHDRALAIIERIAERRPDDYMVPNNRGVYLLDSGQAEAALACFRDAARLQPDAALPRANCGAASELMGRYADARDAYRAALNLGGDDPALRARLVHVSQHLCDWSDFDAHCADLTAGIRDENAPVLPPFTLLAVPGVTGADMLEAAERYSRQFVDIAVATRVPQAGRRARIGYLSSDLYGHATAWLMAEILEQHDADQFDIHLYSYGLAPEDETRQRLRAAAPHFVDLHGLSDADAAARIRADDIDILVDLKGYTRGARPQILAFRPAPVQINYLGFPGSMGASFIDYIIADEVIVPAALEDLYSEKVLRLPHCYQPNDRRRPLPPRPSRESVGLPEEALVLCSFNAAYKLTPHMFDIWCELLRSVPKSVLWLLSSDEITNRNLTQEAARRGIDPERLIFAPRTDLASHLARFRCADIFLDSFPCTAHTTASDALWAGVPVVTRIGETFASRVAASVVAAAELPQLIAETDADYFDIALELATDPALLARCKQHIEDVRYSCKLFDSRGYTRDLERVYEEVLMSLRHPQ